MSLRSENDIRVLKEANVQLETRLYNMDLRIERLEAQIKRLEGEKTTGGSAGEPVANGGSGRFKRGKKHGQAAAAPEAATAADDA